MSRARKIEYLDVVLCDKEIVKIRKGYKVSKRIIYKGNPIGVCIQKEQDRKTAREIERLKQKIRMLTGKK